MDILDSAKAHFTAMGEQSVSVPEWGCDIHFRPLTASHRDRIIKEAGGSEVTMAVLTVLYHARKADGSLAFPQTAASRAALHHKVDPRVISRIASAILAPGVGEPEDDGRGGDALGN